MSYTGPADPFLPDTVQHLRQSLRAVWIEAYNAAEAATPNDARAAVKAAWVRVNAVQKEQKAGQKKPTKDGKTVTYEIIKEAGAFCVYEDGEKCECFTDRAGAEAYAKAREDGEDAKGGKEKVFNESEHPREPRGKPTSGQFVEAGEDGAPDTSSPSAMTPEAAKLLDAVRSDGDITEFDDETLRIAYLAIALNDEPDVARRISEEMRSRQGDASSWAFSGSSPASDAVTIPDDLTKLLKREQVALAGKLAELPMRKLRALQAKTQKAIAEAIGKQREHLDILDRIIISAIDYRSFGRYEAKEALVSFKSFRQPDGRVRWVLTSSGGFEDGEGEDTDTQEKAIDFEIVSSQVRYAWEHQFPSPKPPPEPVNVELQHPMILAVRDDGVVVWDEDGHWLVSYTEDNGKITFAPRNEWQLVKQEWVQAGRYISERDLLETKDGQGALFNAEEMRKRSLVSFKSFRQPDGRVRWVLTSSGGFEDRDGEVVSTAFLESAVKVADRTKERGPLLVFHVPGSDIGTCDFQAVVGEPGFLLESGLFADTEAGRRAAAYYQAHAKETGASIKFIYANRTPDGTYLPPGAILERSLMRRERAAFPWSALELPEVHEMAKLSQEKREELETVLGADLAVQIIDQLDASAEALKQAGVRSKAASDEPTDQAAADETMESAPKTDAGLIAAKETLAEAAQAGGEFELMLTDEALAAVAEKATAAVAGQIVALATQLKVAIDGLDALRAAVEKNAQGLAALQRPDEAKIAEKVAHLPRATVRMMQAPELYRASQAKEAAEPEKDERTDLDRILAVVHGA